MTPKAIDELSPLAQTLNSESSELNATIAAINEKLASLNLGIESWFTTAIGRSTVGFAKVFVGYPNKYSWELAANMDGDGAVTSLLAAPRDVRIAALGLLPNIIADLKAQAEEKIRVMQEAKKLAAEL